MTKQEENFNINLNNFIKSYDFSEDETKFLCNLKYPLNQNNDPFRGDPYVYSTLEKSFEYHPKILEFLTGNYFDPRFEIYDDWELDEGEININCKLNSFENFMYTYQNNEANHQRLCIFLEYFKKKMNHNEYIDFFEKSALTFKEINNKPIAYFLDFLLFPHEKQKLIC